MKLQLNKQHFEKIISRSTGFVDDHSISGIFDNFLIEAVNHNQIAITATDANAHTGIISVMDVEQMNQPESFLVNAKKIDSIVRSIESDLIDLELENKTTLKVKGGRSRFKLPVSSISEYVTRPEITGEAFEVNVGKLLFLIKKTWFAISSDTSNNKMRAGFLNYEDNKLIMVGTDTFQLAYAEIQEENDLSQFLGSGILIAKEDLARLRKILETEDVSNHLKVVVQENTISIHITNSMESLTTTVWLRLLGADYVSYKSIFREPGFQVRGNKKSLQKLLKRAAITLSKETPVLRFNLHENQLLVESNNDLSYQFSEALDVAYSGNNITIGISSKFLADMVNMIDSETFILDLESKESVIMVYQHQERESDRHYFYLLMPMDV